MLQNWRQHCHHHHVQRCPLFVARSRNHRNPSRQAAGLHSPACVPADGCDFRQQYMLTHSETAASVSAAAAGRWRGQAQGGPLWASGGGAEERVRAPPPHDPHGHPPAYHRRGVLLQGNSSTASAAPSLRSAPGLDSPSPLSLLLLQLALCKLAAKLYTPHAPHRLSWQNLLTARPELLPPPLALARV